MKRINYQLYIFCYSILVLNFINYTSFAQITQKQINNQTQSWVSINSTERFTKKWGMTFDAHYRSNQIFASPNFYFLRTGINYWLNDNITFNLGYGHMWLAPTTAGWHTFANENRIHQQFQITNKLGKVSFLGRIRNEQRWQEKIVNDKSTHTNKFTDRVRTLLYFTIPLSKNPYIPSIALANEICFQTGKEVIYNTFDQNRFFIGIKQKINNHLNFDFGYMLLDQEKASGYQYDQNNTLRCFFYYNPDCRKKQ